METLDLLIVTVHVLAVVVWIGALAAIGLVATGEGDVRVRGILARRIYLKAAVPGFGVAFAFGLIRLIRGWNTAYMNPVGQMMVGYSKSPWMHSKLTLALVIIALHHVIGARTRKMANDGAPLGPLPMLTWIVLACAAGAVFFVVVRPFRG